MKWRWVGVALLLAGSTAALSAPRRPRVLNYGRGGITLPPVTIPSTLPLSATDGLGIVVGGQDNAYGSYTGVTTNAPIGALTRYPPRVPPAAQTWPFPQLHEGLSDTNGGNAQDLQTPVTAMLAELRALGGRTWIGFNRSCNTCSSTEIARGGTTPMYDYSWGATGDVARAATARGNAALPFLVAANVLIHGEADDDAGRQATYPDFLRTYQANTDSDGRLRTAQSFPITLFYNQESSGFFGAGGYASTNGYMPIQQNVPAFTNSGTHVMCGTRVHFGSAATNLYPNGQHLSATGQTLQGESLGLCLHSVLEAGVVHRPLLPQQPQTSGSAITVDYSGRIPCQNLNSTNTSTNSCTASSCCSGAPLVFDTTNVLLPWNGDNLDTPLYGFELVCPFLTVRRPWITSVAIAGTQVAITTNRPIPTGCTLSYARTALAGAFAGNGTGTQGYGSGRGNLRDSMAIPGRISGQNIYTWGPTWTSTLAASGPDLSSINALLADHDWDWGWDAPSGTSGTTLVNTTGNASFDLPASSGTWAASSPSGGVVPSTYGSITPADLTDATPGCWTQAAAGESRWNRNNTDDWWYRFVGRLERTAGGDRYLWYWTGDSPANNVAYLATGSNGTIRFSHEGTAGGGVGGSLSDVARIPVAGEWVLVDIFLEARGGIAAGGPVSQVTMCTGGTCINTSYGGQIGDLVTGQMHIGYFDCAVGASFAGRTIGHRFAFGEKARAQFSVAMHQREAALFCPSPPCT